METIKSSDKNETETGIGKRTKKAETDKKSETDNEWSLPLPYYDNVNEVITILSFCVASRMTS